MDIFGTKTPKNHFFRVKLLPKLFFEIFLHQILQFWRSSKLKILKKILTFQPISKQTADEHKNVDAID